MASARERRANPSRRQQIVTASAATLFAQLVRIVGGLMVVPVLLGHLGAEHYGFVAFIVSLMTIFVLLESLLTPVLRNELVRARAAGDKVRVDEALTVGLSAALLLLAASVPLMAPLALVEWGTLLRAPASIPANAAVLAAVAIGVVGACTAVADCLYSAWDDLVRLRIYEAIATGCGLVAVVVIAQQGVYLVWVIVALTAPVPAVRLIAWVRFLIAHRILPRVDFSATLRFFRRHRGASSAAAGTQVLACMASLFPVVLVNQSLGLTDVSVYTVTQRLVGAPANLVISIFPVFWPQLTRAWELQQKDWLSNTVGRGTLAICLGGAMCAAVAYTSGPWFIELWTHGALAVSASFIGWFALLCGAQVLQSWMSTLLNALNEFRYQLVCYASLTLGCAVFGAAGLRLAGLEGLACGLTSATVLCGIAPMAYRAHRRINQIV